MPIVTVLARPHPDSFALVSQVADAVARALDLGDGDVVATFVPAGPSATSGSSLPAAGWPLVSIHGGDRGPAKMEAARVAAEAAVVAWMRKSHFEHGGVWTQWLTPAPQAQ